MFNIQYISEGWEKGEGGETFPPSPFFCNANSVRVLNICSELLFATSYCLPKGARHDKAMYYVRSPYWLCYSSVKTSTQTTNVTHSILAFSRNPVKVSESVCRTTLCLWAETCTSPTFLRIFFLGKQSCYGNKFMQKCEPLSTFTSDYWASSRVSSWPSLTMKETGIILGPSFKPILKDHPIWWNRWMRKWSKKLQWGSSWMVGFNRARTRFQA